MDIRALAHFTTGDPLRQEFDDLPSADGEEGSAGTAELVRLTGRSRDDPELGSRTGVPRA
ncbi:hypothetical protein [Acrocarpospora corrugata]|uniref:hypothetical protein n=1 Tax=Acrocarpospora corrugata TaxID=35763 RepID=UPI001478ADC0|nr:hypothetical protein [Acrocarpospora corrugata]